MSEISDLIYKCVHDPDFRYIKDLYNEGGVMDIFGIVRKELHHSNFLGWLFDSSSNHGLNSMPTSMLLDFICKKSYDEFIDTELNNIIPYIIIHDYIIRSSFCEREKNNIDLIINLDLEYDNKIQKFRIIIENKIDSKLHSNQLDKYINIINKSGADCINLFILLAPEPESIATDLNEYNNNFKLLSYQELYSEILIPVLNKKHLSEQTKTYIKEYIKALKYYSMNNNKTIDEMDKQLLISFLNKYEDIFTYVLTALSEDNPKYNDQLNTMKQLIIEKTKYLINGKNHTRNDLAHLIIRTIVKSPDMSFDEIENKIRNINGLNICLDKSKGEHYKDKSTIYQDDCKCKDGIIYISNSIRKEQMIGLLKFAQELGIEISSEAS